MRMLNPSGSRVTAHTTIGRRHDCDGESTKSCAGCDLTDIFNLLEEERKRFGNVLF